MLFVLLTKQILWLCTYFLATDLWRCSLSSDRSNLWFHGVAWNWASSVINGSSVLHAQHIHAHVYSKYQTNMRFLMWNSWFSINFNEFSLIFEDFLTLPYIWIRDLRSDSNSTIRKWQADLPHLLSFHKPHLLFNKTFNSCAVVIEIYVMFMILSLHYNV